MNDIRLKAFELFNSRLPISVNPPSVRISDFFGQNVFDQKKMQKFLPREAFENILQSIETSKPIDRKVANQIAVGMKEWAISKGATHYTHWFQPLTQASAEKHDAFLDIDQNGNSFEAFDGKLLVQQEPDASSFPNGGIRNTFEARGYTAWDPSSPAFIIGKTLCIPTIFISYTGEALDYKTPLLKSSNFLNKTATKAIRELFDTNVSRIFPTLGWEQEYFLVDEALYSARADLTLTGRTLVGHAAAKDQQLNDHYFGAIPERINAFMQDFETEAHKLGIPLKTRHNEVAPNQFECAPIFEEANLAVDHNQLLMVVMKNVARKHHFAVLFHEKPFKGINGSGKHSNWSLATNTGINLLSPGKTPDENLRFLSFFINVVKAVHDHANLLNASIVSASNQHRMGGNEAPPQIMSVFIGSTLTKIVEKIEKGEYSSSDKSMEGKSLLLNIDKIPEILLDNTDRNRTSPFAFTGNRFEFRAVGSSINTAAPMIVLNTAVGNQLKQFLVDVKAQKTKNRNEAILKVLQKYIHRSKKVLFDGNGYSKEWQEEAEKRGLSKIEKPYLAFDIFMSKQALDLFEKNKIFIDRELEARSMVRKENYTKKIQIESRVLGDICNNHIIPTAIKYQNILIENVRGLKAIADSDKKYTDLAKGRMETIEEISMHIDQLKKLLEKMRQARKQANQMNFIQKVEAYYENVLSLFNEIRYHADKLELIVDDELWPLPKYRELLFYR